MTRYEIVYSVRMTGDVLERVTVNDKERARVVFDALARHSDYSGTVKLYEVTQDFNEIARR